MKLNVVIGNSEYFYPKLVDNDGLQAAMLAMGLGVQTPAPGWLADKADRCYHDYLLETDADADIGLFLEYLCDSHTADSSVFILLPLEPIPASSAGGYVHEGVANFLTACEAQLGAKAVRTVRCSLSEESDRVLTSLRRQVGDEPTFGSHTSTRVSDLITAQGAGVPIELRNALSRNFTYNAVKAAAQIHFRASDSVFEVGDRPEVIAEHYDRLGMRLRAGVSPEQLVQEMRTFQPPYAGLLAAQSPTLV